MHPSPRSLFYALTEGIRISVRPWFLPAQSRPGLGHYVFAYEVRIENVRGAPVQLLARYWRIQDSIGEETEVEGEGVVGEQPVIEPFQVHEYQSYCILKSPVGAMQGHYTFVTPEGDRFRARIPRFEFDAGTPANS
jgi:ApaG protein